MTRLVAKLASVLYLCALFASLALLPLLTQTGRNFEYEYGLLVAWSALALLPLAFLALPKRLLVISSKRVFLAGAFLCLLALPSVTLATGILAYYGFSCLCSSGEALFWAGVQAYPAIILAEALGFLLLYGRERGWSCWRLVFALLGFYGLAFAELAYELWFFPQKRSVHAVFGFLHGPIYDEWIAVDLGLLGLRAAHLALCLALLGALHFRKHIKFQVGFCAFFLGLFFTLRFNVQGYATVGRGRKAIEAVLNQTIQTPDFAIHYQQEGRSLERQTRFHIEDLKTKLGLEDLPFVHIYVYPDAQSKKLLFGGGGTDVTDVKTPSIHLNQSTGLHPTLRHELVHALLSSKAFHGLGFHPNMALTEGLAVALAPDLQPLSLDASAAALLRAARLPSIETLFSPLAFWQAPGANAYAAAGSFVLFLLDQYGASAVLGLYQGKSFDQVFSVSQQDLSKAWQARLLSRYRESQDGLLAEALFREPSVLAAQCPHSQTLLSQEYSDSPLIALRRPRKWQAQKDYWPWRRKLEPQSLALKVRALQEDVSEELRKVPAIPAERVQALVQKARSLQHPTVTVLEDIDLALLQSDLLKLLPSPGLNEVKAVRKSPSATPQDDEELADPLQSLVALSRQKNLGSNLERQIHARILVEATLPAALALPWRRYLAGWAKLPARAAVHSQPLAEPWILQYLRLRNGRDQDWQDLTRLQGALAQDTSEQPACLALAWQQLLGQKFWEEGAYALASEAWQKAGVIAPAGMRAGFELWQRLALSLENNARSI